jgi:hypothetical protein
MMLKGKAQAASVRDNIRAAWMVDRTGSAPQVRAQLQPLQGLPGDRRQSQAPGESVGMPLVTRRDRARSSALTSPRHASPCPLQLQGMEGLWDHSQLGSLDADDRERDVPLSGTASPNPLSMHVRGWCLGTT